LSLVRHRDQNGQDWGRDHRLPDDVPGGAATGRAAARRDRRCSVAWTGEHKACRAERHRRHRRSLPVWSQWHDVSGRDVSVSRRTAAVGLTRRTWAHGGSTNVTASSSLNSRAENATKRRSLRLGTCGNQARPDRHGHDCPGRAVPLSAPRPFLSPQTQDGPLWRRA